MVKKCVCIPHSFLVINVCNQGKTLCSPCMYQTIGGSTENCHIADKVPWHGVQAGVILSDFLMKQVSNIMCIHSCTIFF